jgi:hypothetical protein
LSPMVKKFLSITNFLLICTILVFILPLISGISEIVDKSKWDWVALSPSYFEFTNPSCQPLTIKPTFRVDNYTSVNLEIFSQEYPNGISTGQIFKIYADHLDISKEEIKEVLVCAEYEEGSISQGNYQATLYIESPDRVYQIPLTLKINYWNRFWQKTSFEFKKVWFKQLLTIPTPDGNSIVLFGYHFLALIVILLALTGLGFWVQKGRRF